ncbi:hypothetical protein F4802DRAFT_555065 [Xylaria palmicola]|nr:hypothetical protein F4802DRAFT_555065 [Xylaria palmicola]
MRFSAIATVALAGAVSALPGLAPMITTAPGPEDIATAASRHNAEACTSTDCWASYAECYGSLTFVYLCFTPPPCGTVTSPDPYRCPPRTEAVAAPTVAP